MFDRNLMASVNGLGSTRIARLRQLTPWLEARGRASLETREGTSMKNFSGLMTIAAGWLPA